MEIEIMKEMFEIFGSIGSARLEITEVLYVPKLM